MEMPHAGRMPEKKAFVFAVFGITVLGYFSAGLFALFPGNAYADYAFVGFAGALLVNALVPHLFLTIRCRKYCPGVLTGCFLILPFHGIILHNAATTRLPLAAILLSTSSVFGSALGVLCIGEPMTMRIFLSSALILSGVIAAEAIPALKKT